jgi:hypothetical protein
VTVDLELPGAAMALGTRAAIFARFCSTFSWASRSCEPFVIRCSDSRLRFLSVLEAGSLGFLGGVDGGCVVLLRFSSCFGDKEGMTRDL